jgi:hypothetical protein
MNTDHHVILRVIAKMLIPVITMFAFYVQFHGDFGPGGGFQAGVIIAVADHPLCPGVRRAGGHARRAARSLPGRWLRSG